jgi:hypothetical protein
MDLEYQFYSIVSFSIIAAVLVFTLGDYQIIHASQDYSSTATDSSSSSVQQNSPDQTTFFLPFNSGIADQSANERTYSNEALPFP